MYNVRFSFCDILNNQDLSKLPWPWIILDITKPSSNNYLLLLLLLFRGGKEGQELLLQRTCTSARYVQGTLVHLYYILYCILYVTFWQYTTPKQLHFWHSLYTDVVLFSFSSFWKTLVSAERKKEKYITSVYFFFPHPYPFALVVNKSPAVYFLSRALYWPWRENRASVNRLFLTSWC